MNLHDTEKLGGILERQGYAPASTLEDADVILLNTCSIREKAAATRPCRAATPPCKSSRARFPNWPNSSARTDSRHCSTASAMWHIVMPVVGAVHRIISGPKDECY